MFKIILKGRMHDLLLLMWHISPICYYNSSYALTCDSAGVTTRSRATHVPGLITGLATGDAGL
jgi:hypothetical protein